MTDDKYVFNTADPTRRPLIAYAPHNYGSHPTKFYKMAAELEADVAAANPDLPPANAKYMEVVCYGGPVRKRIKGIEWQLPEGYKPPTDGYIHRPDGPTEYWSHV